MNAVLCSVQLLNFNVYWDIYVPKFGWRDHAVCYLLCMWLVHLRLSVTKD